MPTPIIAGSPVWWLSTPGGGLPKERRAAVVTKIGRAAIQLHILDRGDAFGPSWVRRTNVIVREA
jgi:hypothetical protein